MLDISFSELLLCFLVALVVLGPEKLPRVARGIGRWTGQAKAYSSELKQQMMDARRIFDEESTAMKREFQGAADQGRATASDLPPADAPPVAPVEAAPPAAAPPSPAPAAPLFAEARTPDKHV
jgi:sec-independent protein translocase protein TatB